MIHTLTLVLHTLNFKTGPHPVGPPVTHPVVQPVPLPRLTCGSAALAYSAARAREANAYSKLVTMVNEPAPIVQVQIRLVESLNREVEQAVTRELACL